MRDSRTDIEVLACNIEAVRAGVLRFMETAAGWPSPETGDRIPEAVAALARAAREGAMDASMLLVRQLAAAAPGLRPYRGDSYFVMAFRAMEAASDQLAAAWAWADDGEISELPPEVRSVLSRAGLIDDRAGFRWLPR